MNLVMVSCFLVQCAWFVSAVAGVFFSPLISWHDVLGFVGGRLVDFFFFDMGVVKSFSAHS